MSKILIVDDEPAIQKLFEYVFIEAGHEVALAGNGKEALASIQNSVPDLILLDVAMPEMSGREFAAELNRRAARDSRLAKIRFMVMTGENFMETELNRVFASAKGFVCFFPKMTPPERVLKKAVEIFGGRDK